MGISLPLHAYTVQVSPATTHCDVTWTPQSPAPGDEVTVTIAPHNGYALEEYGFEVYYECTADEWWEVQSSSAKPGRFNAPRRLASGDSNFDYRLEIWYLDANEDDPVEVEEGKTYTFIMPERNVEIEALCIGTDVEYPVTTKQTDNGTTTVSQTVALLGDSIAITATPAEGYVVDKVEVYKYEKTETAGYWTLIDVSKKDATHYYFFMPANPVEVTVTYKEPTVLLGDANGDGVVDVDDYVITVEYIMEENPEGFVEVNADVNEDDVIDVDDLVGIINIIMETE